MGESAGGADRGGAVHGARSVCRQRDADEHFTDIVVGADAAADNGWIQREPPATTGIHNGLELVLERLCAPDGFSVEATESAHAALTPMWSSRPPRATCDLELGLVSSSSTASAAAAAPRRRTEDR